MYSDVFYRRLLSLFFFEANLIRCTEKTFHALFCHHLVTAGVPLRSVAREARHDSAPVDVLVYGEAAGGAFSDHPDKVLAAFEFKGGAYGNRNALSDTIDFDGFCTDMDKLALFRARQVAAWFICIDQADLGVALGPDLRRATARQCAARGLGFAYFCQGERTFLLAPPGRALTEQELPETKSTFSSGRDGLIDLRTLVTGPSVAMVDEVIGSEDDYVFRLYHALRLAGYTSQQISLETYFSFANRGRSRMQLRPDLCLFDSSLNGHFNMYRGGRYNASNDAPKLHSLRALVEVKGSVSTSKNSELQFSRLLHSDLEKLADWKAMLNTASADLGICRTATPTFVLIAIDPRPTSLSDAMRADLDSQAVQYGVDFVYRHVSKLGRVESQRKEVARTVSPIKSLSRASDIAKVSSASSVRFFRLAQTPKSPRELGTYFAAILSATGMDRGEVFQLTRFLSNFAGHVEAGRIVAVEGGYRLSTAGLAYFEDRFHTARGGALDRTEVAAMAKRIRSGGSPDWIPID